MHRRYRSVTALFVVVLIAAFVAPIGASSAADGPQATQSAPPGKDPHGGRGGGGPTDPRCRSAEHRADAAQAGIDDAKRKLATAKQNVAAKQAALRSARGRSAKRRARRALARAKAAKRAAQSELEQAKSRLEAAQRQLKAQGCTS